MRKLLPALLLAVTACSSRPARETGSTFTAPPTNMPATGGRVERAVFSPDGKSLYLLLSRMPEHAGAQIYEADLQRGVLRRVTWQDGDIESFDVGPDGRLLYASTTDELKERPHPSERSPDEGLPTEIYLSDRFGENIQRLTDHPGYDGQVLFSSRPGEITFLSRVKGALIERRGRIDHPKSTSEKPRVSWTNESRGSRLFSADGECRKTVLEGPEQILWADAALRPPRVALVIEEGAGTRLILKELPDDAFSCETEKKADKVER